MLTMISWKFSYLIIRSVAGFCKLTLISEMNIFTDISYYDTYISKLVFV